MTNSRFESIAALVRALARATLRREVITGQRAIVEIDTTKGRWIAKSAWADGDLASIRTAPGRGEEPPVVQLTLDDIEDVVVREARDDEDPDDIGYIRR